MTMHIHKLVAQAPAWAAQTWAARIDAAASLLFLHGYIPMGQRARITAKLDKQFADAIAAGEIAERASPNPQSGEGM